MGSVAAVVFPPAETLLMVASSLVVLPLYPVIGCAFTLLYYDLRFRKEAFDLEILTSQFETVSAE